MLCMLHITPGQGVQGFALECATAAVHLRSICGANKQDPSVSAVGITALHFHQDLSFEAPTGFMFPCRKHTH